MRNFTVLITFVFVLISCSEKDEDVAATPISTEATLMANVGTNVGAGGEGTMTGVSGTPAAALTLNEIKPLGH